MARGLKNLSLEPEAIERGERYGERHGKNLSQLVTTRTSVVLDVVLEPQPCACGE